MAEVWTAQLHIADGSSSEDAPEIAYAERLDDRGQVARLYIVAEPERPGSEQFIEDLVTGKRDDMESVLIATQKADTAFHLLLQVRNKVVDAYDEVKQMRI